MFLALAAAQAAIPFELGPAWGEISRRPALRRVSDKVEIGTVGRDPRTKKLRYWLRHTRTEGGSQRVRWANSANCPAVQTMLESVQELAVPKPAPPGLSEITSITLDGIGYSLRIPATFGGRYADMTVTSNIGTPLAYWVDDSLKRLEVCWTDQQPTRVR